MRTNVLELSHSHRYLFIYLTRMKMQCTGCNDQDGTGRGFSWAKYKLLQYTAER